MTAEMLKSFFHAPIWFQSMIVFCLAQFKLRYCTVRFQVLKCVKVHCLQERQSPAITLGTLVSRCEFIWFMQLRWELHADGQWKVKDVRVAPEFPEEGVLPVGQLVRRTDWENIEGELGMQRGEISFRDFMLWANQDSTDAPPGFRYLSRYADTLARIHDLPITPVQLTPRSAGSGSISLEQAEIVARGRRSIIIRLHPGDEYVVKIGRDSSIETEHRMHQLIDREKCQYLRAAVPGMVGTVEGAGAGLSFIGLELYCDQISRADLHADAAKSRYMEQVNAHTLCARDVSCDSNSWLSLCCFAPCNADIF